MEALTGPYAAVAGLLAAAGLAKLLSPAATAGALRALHLPSRFVLVRLLGAGELVVGVAALVIGGPALAALVAAAYLAFTVFVVLALRSGTPLQSCGCFGKVDTPPTSIHVVFDAVAALLALAVAATGTDRLLDVLSDQPGRGIPLLLVIVVTGYLAYVVLTVLPAVSTAARAR